MIRSLRTLLLEGNQLVILPNQLCRLPHLTGLNISRNPLQDPPKRVTDKGTKVWCATTLCMTLIINFSNIKIMLTTIGCAELLARDGEWWRDNFQWLCIKFARLWWREQYLHSTQTHSKQQSSIHRRQISSRELSFSSETSHSAPPQSRTQPVEELTFQFSDLCTTSSSEEQGQGRSIQEITFKHYWQEERN